MRIIIIMLIALLVSSPVAMAMDTAENVTSEEGIMDTVEDSEEDITAEEPPKENKKRLSDILQDEGLKEIKPLDFNEIGDKILDFGDKSYETLQKASIPMLVWGIAIAVVIMFVGAIIGKAVLGVGVLVIVLVGFAIIHYAPDLMATVLSWIP